MNDDQGMVFEAIAEFAGKATLAQSSGSVKQQPDLFTTAPQAPESQLDLPSSADKTLPKHFHLTVL
jgi:hypothetical protein